jgi:hypothetical protein
MKKFLLPLLLVLLVLPMAVQASVLTFTSPGGEPFQVKLNGTTINHRAATFVQIPNLLPGKHYVEFKVMGRRGVHHLGTRLVISRGIESSYALHVPSRRGDVRLRLIGERLLLPPPVVVTPAPPLPRYPDDRYDRYEPVPPRYERDKDYCRNMLSREDVDRLSDAMKSRSFESTKLTIAREAVRNSSILAEDLKFILGKFDYESTRVEFAKFAYDYVCDREHFYYVYDAFQFDSSVRNLEEYTSRRR